MKAKAEVWIVDACGSAFGLGHGGIRVYKIPRWRLEEAGDLLALAEELLKKRKPVKEWFPEVIISV